MNRIDPDRLTVLRAARKLSRQRLAEASHVSARQIARLESVDDPVDVRATTLTRLADALEVVPDVLAGVAPVPTDAGAPGAEPATIAPNLLAELRRRKGWSRRQLAESARVSPQLVERVERGTKPCRVRPRNLARLARALDVDEAVLRGTTPPEPAPPTPTHASVTVRTAPGLRLAYDLVERRYGAAPRDLFALAPLLFVLLAEGSLDRRRAKLELARQANRTLDELGREHATLYFAKDDYRDAVEWGMDLEQASIDQGDVLGRALWDEEAMDTQGFTEDDMTVTPFADHLRELADAIHRPDAVAFHDLLLPDQGLYPWGAHPYTVCADDLEELAGGSRAARWALEWGGARISEIPDDLMADDAKARRAAWLGSRLPGDVKAGIEEREALREELGKVLTQVLAEHAGE